MRHSILATVLLVSIIGCTNKQAGLIHYPQTADNALNFIVANDLGRNGYYEQKPIAAVMGLYAENADVEFIAAAGDVHHFNGVASTSDPLWTTNYEHIYTHPDLMIDWYAICGNHEYRGNTQAVLDYSQISRRWIAPSKYYTKVFEAGDSAKCLLVFIDTTPMIDKYRDEPDEYPDACKQDFEKQLVWIDSVLVHSSEKWKIVIGHHPVYAYTKKNDSERSDMQARLAPLLEKNGVDVYFCGHIHNFQHIKPAGSRVEYVVNSAGSLARKVAATDGTVFCSDKAGFTFCSATDSEFRFTFVDGVGTAVYSYGVEK
ncbi:MAG: metallophosphoesterase [Dysgonamonadaceae bacterium]|jgi:hypothetical protein|nr:metallophosphoesterase [Dysgonamonadaceae bacterium]